MSLESNRDTAESKLILLYLIDKINMNISNLQITKIILEKKFMNYFLLQQYLNELCSDNLLTTVQVDGKTCYAITDSGKQTLGYLHNHISSGIKALIDQSMNSIRKNIRNETSITADFYPENENKYIVSCKIREDDYTLIDLNITVGTRNDARTICENWKNHAQLIYQDIVSTLTRNRTQD